MYVGRPTALGNPFVIGPDGTRAEVIAMYRTWISHKIDMGDEKIDLALNEAAEVDVLLCSCAPAACHADVIKEILGL